MFSQTPKHIAVLRVILYSTCQTNTLTSVVTNDLTHTPIESYMGFTDMSHEISGCYILSRKFVPTFRMNNIPAFVQIMVWRRPGDKPLSEPMMFSLLTYICVTRPQWVNPWPRDSRLLRAPRTVVTPGNQVTITPSSSGQDDFPSQLASEYGFR